MKKVFLDASWMAYRAHYTTRQLAHNDIPTGVVFGFLGQLKTVCLDPQVQSNQVHVFFDSRRSLRRLYYPDYKRTPHRTERTPEERESLATMYEQLNKLRRSILPKLGVPVYRQTGLEADDLIAMACATVGWDDSAVIISADKDLLQCVRANVSWYNPASEKGPVDLLSFKEEYGISPDFWGDVKAIAGCAGDGVKGVPGVGEKSAVAYLIGNLPEDGKRYKAIVSPEGQSTQLRNHELVKLPHRRTAPFELEELRWDADAFRELCREFGMEDFVRYDGGWGGWSRVFEGGIPNHTPRRRKRYDD